MEVTERQKHTLNKLLITVGAWDADGGENEKLERKFESLLTELHADRGEALKILYTHVS